MADSVIKHTKETDAAATIAHYLQDRGKNIRFMVYPGMLMNRELSELELGQRAYNCLKRSGYETAGQLAEGIEGIADLMKIRGTGKKTAQEIMYKLFLLQYTALAPERQHAYLEETIRMNGIPCEALPEL